MVRKLFFNFVLTLPLILTTISGFSQRIIYVDHSAPCPGNGGSWVTAYCNLQDALSTAISGDQIWVAAGVYYPDRGAQANRGNINMSFVMKSGVEIYGGFMGGETALGQRDYNQNQSILSGNIHNLNNMGDNSNTVVNATGTDRSAVLDGFIVEDGLAFEGCSWASPTCSGGNIFFMPGSPTLRNLIVRNGKASYGGGLSMLNNCNPLIENVSFENNFSFAHGGAIHIRNSCSPEFINCKFERNFTNNHGGAFHCRDNNTLSFTNCVFRENHSGAVGGAMVIQNGSTAEFFNCDFFHNIASSSSGGVHFNNNSGGYFENCLFQGNLAQGNGGAIGNHDNSNSVVKNSVFRVNESFTFGGALRNTANSTLEVSNSNVLDNTAVNGGGIFNGDSRLTVNNLKLRDNEAINLGGGLYLDEDSDALVINCYIQGNQSQTGGGIYIAEDSKIEFVNNLISGNRSQQGGGLFATANPTVVFRNTTVASNFAELRGGGILLENGAQSSFLNSINYLNQGNENGNQFYLSANTNLEIKYSCIQSENNDWVENGTVIKDGFSITESPQFIDPVSALDSPTAAGDYRLQSSSPAVDVGDNSLIVGYSVDLDLNTRILNDIVDMGAFENMRERCIEDIFLEVCPGESVYGIPIYNDTLFVENFIGVDDCDSTIYTHVEIYEVQEPVLEVVSAPCTPDSTTIHLLNEEQFEVYSWSHGSDSARITVFESGTYTIHAADNNGCPSQQNIDVEIYSTLEITLESSTNNNSFNFPDGSIEISIQGGAPPYEILWDNGQNSTFINGLLGGTYCVEILDQSGCLLEECFVIENNYPDLLVDYQIGPINCPEEEFGEINITISDGSPPIEVSIESEDGTYTDSFRIDTIPFDLNLVQLPIGEYQVNIGDLLGQEVLFDFSIEAPPVIELLSTNIDMWPCDSLETLGQIEVEATGGTPPLVYHWNGEAGPEPALEFSEYGIYELIISDSLGCISAPFEFEINEPEPLEVNIEYSGPECPGIEDGHILFSISGGTPPYTVYVNEAELPGPSFELGSLSSGEYEYLITDFTGCTLEGMVDLQYQNDYYLEIRESQTISLGDTLFLEGLTNMDGTLTELWSPDALLRDDPPLGIWAFPFEDTTYELTLINDKGCVLRDSVHISVTPTDYEVFIPNAFSPNADGINDFFTVYAGSDVAVIQELIIFNRWGSVVWRNSHFRPNLPDYGWDGYFRGEKLQGGVYVYTASILFKNGVSREYSGEFILIE